MANKKLSLKSNNHSTPQSIIENDRDNIGVLLKICKSQISSRALLKSCSMLEEERASIHRAQDAISHHPLLAAFILWAKDFSSKNATMVNASRLILEFGFIRNLDKNGKILTIENTKTYDHVPVIDAIRCVYEWTLQLRESVVSNYISFINWLSDQTHGFIRKIEDPDQLLVQGRLLSYQQFISLIGALKDKERVAAKLLYFGGKRTLDDVINLELNAIDFKQKSVHYKSQFIHYPSHVFMDIQMIIDNRTRGRLFLGRQNAPLSRLTIFRKFRIAAQEVGLGKSFLPTVLTSNQ